MMKWNAGKYLRIIYNRVRSFLPPKWYVVYGFLLFLATAALMLYWPMDVSFYDNIAVSGEMLDRSGRLMYAFLNTNDQWCFPRALDEISPYLINATIAVEDQRFAYHPGVDPLAIGRAAWQNIKQGHIVSGASTLAMQVVKLTYRRNDLPCSKPYQAIQAVRLQWRIGRDKIVRLYLNSAPYGYNLVGCEAASRRYFGKSANELTLPEAAMLAGLPKAPGNYSPYENPLKTIKRRNFVLQRMYEEGFIDKHEFEEARKISLNVRHHDSPSLSPHWAMYHKHELEKGLVLKTTLDAGIQQSVEGIVKEAVDRTTGRITNAAAIVIDTQSAEVLARVGSADFFNTPGGGQYDACRAARSPGSTLKPFTYGVAMQNDYLYPCETLLDNTWDQGLYNPENFSQSYRGLISAHDALKQSLNVPAVTVLQRMGISPLYDFLVDAGISTLSRPEQYGLSLTLGNCEVHLEELSTLYVMLANLGEYRPLKIKREAITPHSKRMLSRGICLKLYDMLEQSLPHELSRHTMQTVDSNTRVAWKTGTSQGYRDAWTFAFNQHYVVGVWMGNNDAASSRLLVGRRSALPLTAKIFRSLPVKSNPAWPAAKNDLKEVQVCSVSGLPATKWCKYTRYVHLPREQYLHRVCDMHYPDTNTSSLTQSTTTILERWPGTAQGWDLADINSPVIPNRSLDNNSNVKRREHLRILSPSPGSEFILTGESNGDRIQLKTSVDQQTSLHWYLDDRYIGQSSPQSPLYIDLKNGTHHLTCMTGNGRTDSIRFKVELPTGHNLFD